MQKTVIKLYSSDKIFFNDKILHISKKTKKQLYKNIKN